MKKIKQILALTGAILLIVLYLSTLIFSLMRSEMAQGLFKASVFCTVAVPVLIYAYMLIYRVLRGWGDHRNNAEPDKKPEEKEYRKQH